MNDYCILVKNGRAEANRIIAGKLEPIHFRGEVRLDAAGFWPLFREKIEYSIGEAIALLVICDDESFVVDPELTIAEQFSCPKHELAKAIDALSSPGCMVRAYPEIDLRFAIHRQPGASLTPGSNQDAVDENSLQSYFSRKTQEYKRG